MKTQHSTRRSRKPLSPLHALLVRMMKTAAPDDLSAWERIEKVCRLIISFEAMPCHGGPCPYVGKET